MVASGGMSPVLDWNLASRGVCVSSEVMMVVVGVDPCGGRDEMEVPNSLGRGLILAPMDPAPISRQVVHALVARYALTASQAQTGLCHCRSCRITNGRWMRYRKRISYQAENVIELL